MAQSVIFDEDEVCLDTEKGLKYGLVLESAEYLSSDEEGDDLFWDRLKKGSVRIAWHPDGDEEVIAEKDLTLTDRSLMPGDVVRRLIEGQDSQRGYIRNTSVFCHVQILSKSKVICDIDSRDLTFMEEWDEETDSVYLDSWVGKVEKITDSIILRLPDGAKVRVDTEDFYTELSSFEDIHEKRDRETEFCVNTYYVGQRLKGSLGELENMEWLTTTKLHNADQARKKDEKEVICTVEKVDTESLDVTWLCQGFSKACSDKSGPPPRTLAKDDIKRLMKLECFEPCSIQIGDHAFYKLKDRDIVHNVPQRGNKTLIHHVLKNKLSNRTKSCEAQSSEVNMLNERNFARNQLYSQTTDSSQINGGITNADTTCQQNSINETADSKVPNLHQDGAGDIDRSAIAAELPNKNSDSTSEDKQEVDIAEVDEDDEYDDISDAESSGSAASSSSNPSKKKKVQHKKGGSVQTKLLKKKKLKKSKKKEDIAMWEFKPGDTIPVEVVGTYSYAEVMWQDGTIENGIKSTELYPIHHLDEQEFFPGDFVVTAESADLHEYGVVQSVDHAGRTCMLRWIKPYVLGKSNTPTVRVNTEEVSVYDLKDHSDYKFRPGAIVVRVGGYGANNAVAAGQVYELRLDGQIDIIWADRSRSLAYPQELYLIGDDLSELSELDDDSNTSSCDSDSDTDKSWETEGEEEVDTVEECDEDSKEKDGAARAPRIDGSMESCFDTVVESLEKLEDLFGLSDVEYCQTTCFSEVVTLYKACKKVDSKLNTTYFDDAKLRKLMTSIRDEMKKDKTAKFAKRIQDLIQQNMAALNNLDTDGDTEVKKTESTSSQFQTVETTNSSENCNENENMKKDEAVGNKPNSPTSPTVDQGTQTSLPTECGKCTLHTRELCQKAVHLLREIVIGIREELAEHLVDKVTSNKTKEEIKSSAIESPVSIETDIDTGARVTTASSLEDKSGKKDLKLSLPAEANGVAIPAVTPQTPAEVRDKILFNLNGFVISESAPPSHKFIRHDHHPANSKAFMSAVMRDHKILNTSLPLDIFVKSFEDRMDLFTVMIHGPKNTPYEDGLFFFDVKLPNEYPSAPPRLHYIAYCTDRLNPNLYEDGKVCVSLLGTWTGKGTEVWTSDSTLLQVLISIQGLILVSEPYYNEAGYERQKGTQQGLENSRMYNEMALIKMIQSMSKIAKSPPEMFRTEVQEYIGRHGPRMIARLEYWLANAIPASGPTISIQDTSPKSSKNQSEPTSTDNETTSTQPISIDGNQAMQMETVMKIANENGASSADQKPAPIGMPDFPLLPVSKGFVLTLKKLLENFRKTLNYLPN